MTLLLKKWAEYGSSAYLEAQPAVFLWIFSNSKSGVRFDLGPGWVQCHHHGWKATHELMNKISMIGMWPSPSKKWQRWRLYGDLLWSNMMSSWWWTGILGREEPQGSTNGSPKWRPDARNAMRWSNAFKTIRDTRFFSSPCSHLKSNQRWFKPTTNG